MDDKKFTVLFLCTGNSCRSQMAEGFANAARPSLLTGYSAGIKPNAIDPRAVQVMAELGIDIQSQHSKDIDSISRKDFDCVVTVCSNAQANCPLFLGDHLRIHQPFDDPPHLTKSFDDENEILQVYRRVRDEIGAFVDSLPSQISKSQKQHRGLENHEQ